MIELKKLHSSMKMDSISMTVKALILANHKNKF